MGKASGKAEFRTIAAKLEMGIRQKVFSDRLPNIRTLQEQFDVSKQTMTRALALLQKSGIVMSQLCLKKADSDSSLLMTAITSTLSATC